MKTRVLVAYATRSGSSAGVASAIAHALQECGAEVEIRKMYDITDVSEYDAVIAGSPVHNGQWLPEALEFLVRHQSTLNSRPFAAFMVCMTLSRKLSSKQRKEVYSWMEPVRSLVQPISEGYFGGKMEIRFLPSFIDRFRFRLRMLVGLWRQGDHRDWKFIKGWAKDTYLKMHVHRSKAV